MPIDTYVYQYQITQYVVYFIGVSYTWLLVNIYVSFTQFSENDTNLVNYLSLAFHFT